MSFLDTWWERMNTVPCPCGNDGSPTTTKLKITPSERIGFGITNTPLSLEIVKDLRWLVRVRDGKFEYNDLTPDEAQWVIEQLAKRAIENMLIIDAPNHAVGL